jgi:hypothetical protein
MFRLIQDKTFFVKCILLVLVLLSAPVACASAAEPYDQQIIWMDAKERTDAMFVPERLLNENTLEDLPLIENDRSSLKSILEGAARGNPEREELYKQLGRKYIPCPPASRDDRSPKALSLLNHLKARGLAFVATVEDVVPGWSFWIRQPVNMAYVKPLLDLRGTLQTADRVLAYPEEWASITVNNVEVCYNTPPEGFYRARKGDKVLVSGLLLFQPNPRVIYGAAQFLISGGRVLPQPYSGVLDFTPIAIDDLRRELEGNNEPK